MADMQQVKMAVGKHQRFTGLTQLIALLPRGNKINGHSGSIRYDFQPTSFPNFVLICHFSANLWFCLQRMVLS
jgi:uncharacterized protein (DUF58 family)